MKSLLRHPLSILAFSLVAVWFVHAQTTNDPVDALYEQYEKALALFEKNPNQAEQDLQELESELKLLKQPSLAAADLWHDIGRFYYDQNANYAKALVRFENAFSIRQKLLANEPTNNDLARSYFMLAVTHKYLGNYDPALNYIKQAINVSELGNNAFMLAKEYLELGDIYDYLGDYDQSIVCYERAYPHILAGSRDQANLLSQHYKRLASLYLAKGNYQVSINYNLSALSIFKDSITPSVKDFYSIEMAGCYTNMNISYQALDKPDSAYYCLQKAIFFYEKSKTPDLDTRLANVYLEMGNLFSQQKKVSEAQIQHQKAIDILLKTNPNHPFLSGAYAGVGEDLLRLDKPREARAYFEKALKVVVPTLPTAVKDLTVVTDKCLAAMSGIARSEKAMNQPQKAIMTFRQLDTLMTNLRISFKEDGSKFNLSKEALPIYENAIEAALTIGDTAAALDFCERNKAVVLREALQDVNAKLNLKIDPLMPSASSRSSVTILAHEKALKDRLNYYQKQRFDANDSLKGIWQDSIQRTKGDLEVLIKNLERTEPDYFKQKYAPIRSLPIIEIQKNLPSEMLFLEYFMSENKLFLFAISKDRVQVYPSVFQADFKDSINVFLQNIKKTSPDNLSLNRCATTGYKLYNWLLKRPLADFNADGHITRLRIVPDGILNYIPFDALIEQPTVDMKRQDVAFVVKKYAVSYVFSNQLLNENKPTKWSFFNKNSFGGFGIGYKNTPLSTLPFAETEVSQLQFKMGGDAFTQSNGTAFRSTFLNKAPNYSILHLSMHGTVDDKEPLKSALQFVNEKDSLDPVAVLDVNNLQLTNNDLTVLSACNTGTGTLQRGEGIMSLSRAFAQAGCRSLVMSLWTLQDAYTTEIVTHFYNNLNKKQPKDIALAEAKRQFLMADQSERRAPNYWAALVVMGSVESIDTTHFSWKMILGGLLILILGLGLWYRLKNQR